MTIIYSSTWNGGIGFDGKLVRTDKDDFRHFRKVTNGGTLIMGRKTFIEINRALRHRKIIVLSKTLERDLDGVYFVKSKGEALSLARVFNRPIFICGGAEIYNQFLPQTTKIIQSVWHDENIVCDTFFRPNLNGWDKVKEQSFYNFTVREYDKVWEFS